MASSQQGNAVRILSINDDYSWQLEEDDLGRILLQDSIKDKPVMVVSIAGAYRKGKSYLMNFFIRYMRSRGEKDWLGHPDAPLEGFDWKHGSRRLTCGIVLWDEVFLVTTSDGEEVAVLFMDTQGLFDCESTMEECTNIFALSLLTSSVQIYNIFHNIQEDHLQHLEFFTQYGQLALKEAMEWPFQRLILLVRDSNSGTYGAEAGRALVKECLEPTQHLRPEHQRLRESLRAHFPDIEGFLMPHPGSEVATEKSYDGRLSVVDEKFKKHLQELVPWILDSDHLVVKKVNGKEISCRELFIYMKAYVQALKSDALPEPKSLLQASAEASHLTAKDKAAKVYMAVMSNIPRGDLEKLRSTHMEALATAKEIFNSVPKIGGDHMSKAYLGALTSELQERFDSLYAEEEAWLQKQLEEEERRREEEAEQERKRQMEFEEKITETEIEVNERCKKENECREKKLREDFDCELAEAATQSKQMEAKLAEKQKEQEKMKKENKNLKFFVGITCVVAVAAGGVGLAAGLAVNPVIATGVGQVVFRGISFGFKVASMIA